MAENDHQANPFAPVNSLTRSDEEIAPGPSKEERHKRNMKRFVSLVAFVILQTGVILFFSLTVMRIKHPKFRIRSGNVEDFSVSATDSNSFSMTLSGEFGVRNTNFGHFEFDNGTVTFACRGTTVGEVSVAKARARARTTKKISFNTVLSSSTKDLSSDINAGILPITSYSKLSGKVVLMKLFKKKKSAEMNCTMDIVIATEEIRNWECK